MQMEKFVIKLISARRSDARNIKNLCRYTFFLGIIPINLKVQLKAGEQSQYVYPAALVQYKDKMVPVNLYSGTQTSNYTSRTQQRRSFAGI